MRFEDQRNKLVQTLRSRDIHDESVLMAFAETPREDYVPDEFQEYSYCNQPLPLSDNQTISQPAMIALMMQELSINPQDRILEIGTGSGYQTALLAHMAKEVCTIELLERLSLKAQKTLHNAGFRNIYYRIGDGWQGWEKAYPPYKEFDKIIVSAAADEIPQKLVNQLAEGGIMVVPVGGTLMQHLFKITKKDGELIASKGTPCAFVPFVRPGKQQ
ncbi:MAG: protein-L-isoaspartate(D-aspartate) O-methyltransferase [Candidatus Cloacimonetes bacterium]|jgi:protein-L-isoaspartate(D-aspartate) O-methyltransferase|nr:protein-L-isoaspartate(D-aspartate) O-methyltransferase [Candidatus Cloacimonadota bacterium]